ncbi:MAG: YlcI/YnfO family protein [Candidatus Promineifilaceae bacterium]
MGRFTLRLPETLHDELKSRARQEGVSLNQYIVYALTRQVASTYTIQLLPEARISEQKASYGKLLDSLGAASLETTREFLAERETAEQEDGVADDVRARLEEKIGKKEE